MKNAVKLTRLKRREQLDARLAELGISLPIDDAVDADGPLADAIEVAGRRIGNRFCVLPMEGWDATPEGRPSDLVLRRWRRFGERSWSSASTSGASWRRA